MGHSCDPEFHTIEGREVLPMVGLCHPHSHVTKGLRKWGRELDGTTGVLGPQPKLAPGSSRGAKRSPGEKGGWTYPGGGHLQIEGGAGQCEAVEEGLGRHACEEMRPGGCRAPPGPGPPWGAAPSPTSPRGPPLTWLG